MSDVEVGTGSRYGFVPDPDQPGWLLRMPRQTGRFGDVFGAIRIRPEEGGPLRCRFETGERHANPVDFLHGGFLMAAIDQALFMIAVTRRATGPHGAVTLDCNTSFVSPGRVGTPLDIVGEVLRESSRLVFMRGLAEQEGRIVCSFTGTLSKVSTRA